MPRRLAVIEGGQAECLQQMQAQLTGVNALWVTTAPQVADALPAKKAHTVLGREFAAVVFDAHSGFDVNAFAAVSGTLRGGGTFYLLTPPLTEWAAFPDPDYRRFIPYPYLPEDAQGRFLRRLVGLLALTPTPLPRAGRGGWGVREVISNWLLSKPSYKPLLPPWC